MVQPIAVPDKESSRASGFEARSAELAPQRVVSSMEEAKKVHVREGNFAS